MTDTSHYLSGEDYTRDANGAALPPDVVAWPVKLLPAGVHPGDASTAQEGVPGTPQDQSTQWRHGREPWGVENEEALPVYNRAAHDWQPGQVFVSTASYDSAQAIVVNRQKGRLALTIWVPLLAPDGSTPNGVLIAPNVSALQQGGNDCVVLNAGDSTTIPTEGPVYAACISGKSTGFCQFISLTNPLGRGRDLSA